MQRTTRKIVIGFLVLFTFLVAAASLIMRNPDVPIGSSEATVVKILGIPRSRIDVPSQLKVPKCNETGATYALVFDRRFGRVLVVYFDQRHTVLCVLDAFSVGT